MSKMNNMKNGMILLGRRFGYYTVTPVQKGIDKIRSMFGEKAVAGQVVNDVRADLEEVTAKPNSKKGYVKIGKKYVAKKLLFFLTLLILGLIYLGVQIAAPIIISKHFTKTMVVNTSEMKGYTGKVKLIDGRESCNVLYIGDLKEGRIEGEGTLYDYQGSAWKTTAFSTLSRPEMG